MNGLDGRQSAIDFLSDSVGNLLETKAYEARQERIVGRQLTIGRFLLNLNDNLDKLNDDLARTYPDALRAFFEALPQHIMFEAGAPLTGYVASLPEPAQIAVQPHLYHILN